MKLEDEKNQRMKLKCFDITYMTLWPCFNAPWWQERSNQRRWAVVGFGRDSLPCWPQQQIWAGQEWKTSLPAEWLSDVAKHPSKNIHRRRISESIGSLQREAQDEKATGNTAEKLKKRICISEKGTRAEKAPRFFCNHSPLLFDLQPFSAGFKNDWVVCLNHLYWLHITKPKMYNKQS